MKLKLGLRGLSIVGKLEKGSLAISLGKDNPKVPGNAGVLAAFKTANDNMAETLVQVGKLEGELRALRSRLAEHERAWDAAYGALGAFTQCVTHGEPAALFSAGFDVRRPSGSPRPVGTVTHLRVELTEKPGDTFLSWRRPVGASAFLVQCSEDLSDETRWRQLVAVTDTAVTVRGAHPGQRAWFRVAALSAHGTGPWTTPAARPVL